MNISGDFLFDSPQKLVWESLQDPNVLSAVMPGGKGFEQVGNNQFSGMLEVKVGPVQGVFEGKITLSDIIAPESYQIVVDGKGAPGFVKATGRMRLEARDQQTFMDYSGQAQVGGRIASVGQRLVESAARSIIRQSLEALNEYLKIEAAKQAPPPTATSSAVNAAAPAVATGEYKPPSQMGLAMNVARDVLNDLIPPKYQPWVLAAAVVVIVLIIWLIGSR